MRIKERSRTHEGSAYAAAFGRPSLVAMIRFMVIEVNAIEIGAFVASRPLPGVRLFAWVMSHRAAGPRRRDRRLLPMRRLCGGLLGIVQMALGLLMIVAPRTF